MIGGLPESLTVDGQEYPIRSDYRNVLQTFEAFNDPEMEQEEKWIAAIFLMYEDFQNADDVIEAANNGFDLKEAIEQLLWFISGGNIREDKKPEKPTYDWVQDEQMIFAAVNKVAGREVRAVEYMHWWTFLGFFNEIGDGNLAYIIGIRQKLNNGKKLDKAEREFLNKNKDIVVIKPHLTAEQQEEEDEFQALLNDVL